MVSVPAVSCAPIVPRLLTQRQDAMPSHNSPLMTGPTIHPAPKIEMVVKAAQEPLRAGVKSVNNLVVLDDDDDQRKHENV
jgi:hypothetical protein